MRAVLFLIGTLLSINLAFAETNELPVLKKFDLKSYMGLWYEIASLPKFFTRHCFCTTARYTQDNDQIKVQNSCRWKTANGEETGISGKAFSEENALPGHLKVQFFWPFSSNYWVLELGAKYEYAVVGDNSGKSFWILSRSPKMDTSLFESIKTRFSAFGFDLSKLKSSYQDADCIYPT